MLHLTILAVGRVRDRNLKALCADYRSRLQRYAKVRVVSVRDGKGDSPDVIKAAEADDILGKVPARSELVALDERGESLTSEAFSQYLSGQATRGRSRWAFAIGGPWGLDERVVEQSRLHLSLSAMTFPHELARLLLFEQLYRAMTIWRGEPYHK